jgi:hypothetical protein
MPRNTLATGLIRLLCANCGHAQTPTRVAWSRIAPLMGCGFCRKITRWSTAP